MIQTLPSPTGNLTKSLPGLWWLQSREDYTKAGERRIEPTLGSDPIAILTFSNTHFAAQFMKRDREDNAANKINYSAKNNTSAVGGYDAYFGTYEINEETGLMTTTLIGSLSPDNIGMIAHRNLRIIDDKLIIQLETTTPDGEAVTRTLTWKRLT